MIEYPLLRSEHFPDSFCLTISQLSSLFAGECIPPRTTALAASTFNLYVSLASLDVNTFQVSSEPASEESSSLRLRLNKSKSRQVLTRGQWVVRSKSKILMFYWTVFKNFDPLSPGLGFSAGAVKRKENFIRISQKLCAFPVVFAGGV